MNALQRFNKGVVILAASLGLAASGGAYAVDMFLKLGTIKGESTDSEHKDEIEVDSWQWGLSRPTAPMTFGGAMTSGKLCMSAITLTKRVDLSTTFLMANVVSGMTIPKAILIGRRNAEVPIDYIRIELDNVKVTSLYMSSGGEVASEAFSLAFTKARVVYTRQDPKTGGPGQPVETIIDLAKVGGSIC